jgi:hypothetical protein
LGQQVVEFAADLADVGIVVIVEQRGRNMRSAIV